MTPAHIQVMNGIFFLVHRPARANRPCLTVKELILPAAQTLMPTITSPKFREYMFVTLPSASISRLMIQRKKTTTAKKQAVRQAEILPFLLSIKMLLLQCLQEQAAEFAPICSALRQTRHWKSRALPGFATADQRAKGDMCWMQREETVLKSCLRFLPPSCTGEPGLTSCKWPGAHQQQRGGKKTALREGSAWGWFLGLAFFFFSLKQTMLFIKSSDGQTDASAAKSQLPLGREARQPQPFLLNAFSLSGLSCSYGNRNS